MQKIRNQFPNLDALIAFEAAARLSSFAAASKELNVTASAISQQIKSLETALGTPLFNRGHRSVTLSERGKEFFNSVTVALRHLSNAAHELSPQNHNQTLTIAGDTAIIKYWLMPRLGKLETLFPEYNFRIRATDVRDDLMNADFMLAILHGRGGWPGLESTLLFGEEVFPVCAPTFLASLEDSIDHKALCDAPLLDLEYESWHWMNWTIWLTEMALPATSRSRRLVSNNYESLIDAARSGMGFALAWRHFHDDDLRSGALVRPLAGSVQTPNGYYLAWPYNQPMTPQLEAVRDWIIAATPGKENLAE